MFSQLGILVLGGSAALVIIAPVAFVIGTKVSRNRHKKKESELRQELLQSSILSQIAQRISYTLDANQIVEVMTGSLDPLLSYASIGFIARDDENRMMISKIRLREQVSETFIGSVKENMEAAFGLLCSEACKGYTKKETITGEVASASAPSRVGSYFNLPVILDGEAIAIINVSSPKKELYTSGKTDILYKVTSLASQAVSRLRKVIRDEQHRMNAMVSSLPNGLFMVDQEERVVVMNQVLHSLLKFGSDEDVRLSDILARTREFMGLHELMEQAQTEKKPVKLDEVEMSKRLEQITASPVIDNEGNNIGTTVTFLDVTAQKQLEQLREQFTAMLVHELRAPLTAIKWNIEELPTLREMSEEDLNETSRDMLGVVNRMLSLVNDMLDSAKIEAGKFDIKRTVGDLTETIQRSVKTFEATAESQNIKLEADVDKLPQISFDANRIEQVMVNLLSNAIKFTKEGSVIVKAHAKEASVRVEVTDTGSGVSEADRTKLFKRFEQLSRGGLREAGTGLGLIIVKGIIEAHGGTVGFKPNAPKGSIFWFEIPVSAGKKKTA